MKTASVVGIVVAVHCVVVGSLIFIQGCGTTRTSATGASAKPTPMPPLVTEEKPKLVPPTPIIEREPKPLLEAKTTTYVVAKGDSLSSIAHKFHMSVAEIKTLNNIKEANKIRVGQKLILPGELDLKAAPDSKKAASKSKAAGGKVAAEGNSYVVIAGDSLSKIASKFGTTPDAIRNANGLTGNKVMIGRKLVIPAGAPKKEVQGKTKKEAPKAEAPAPAAAAKKVAEPAPAAAVPPAAPAAPNVNLSTEPVSKLSNPDEVSTATATEATKSGEAAKTGDKAVSAAQHTYVVVEGDDLKTVAMTYAVSEEDIKKLNGLTDTTLKAGQILKIP